MPSLIRAVLAPVLLAQGRRMFRTMPRLPEPPGDRAGTAGEGPPLRLIVAGDSSAAGVGADSQTDALLGRLVARLAERHTVSFALHARFGSTIPRTTAYLDRQPSGSADVAVLAVGLNDVIAGRALAPWLDDYRRLVDTLRVRFGAAHVVVSGMPLIGQFPAVPQPLRWVLGREATRHDAALRHLAEDEPGLHYVGLGFAAEGPFRPGEVAVADVMARDGFHPGPRVYDEWARRAVEALAGADAVGPAP
jgi:lysophospholipase L1-like esterase